MRRLWKATRLLFLFWADRTGILADACLATKQAKWSPRPNRIIGDFRFQQASDKNSNMSL